MSYPRNMQYLKNELWCNYDMCSSEYCSKLRNRGINSIYVGVELLYKYAGTSRRFFSVRFPTLYAKCIGKRSAWKIRQNNLLFQMYRLEGKKERKETKRDKKKRQKHSRTLAQEIRKEKNNAWKCMSMLRAKRRALLGHMCFSCYRTYVMILCNWLIL